MFRKFLAGLNAGTWLYTFGAMIAANITARPSDEPLSANPFLAIATFFTALFMAISVANTIPMFTTKDTSLSWPALASLGIGLCFVFLVMIFRLDPGTSGLLYRADLMKLFGLGLILGATIDLIDLIAVTVIKKQGNNVKR